MKITDPRHPAEALATVRPYSETDTSHLEHLNRCGAPGTPLWVMHVGGAMGRPAVALGVTLRAVEAVLGNGPGDPHAWTVAWRYTDDEGGTGTGRYAVPLDDARRAWWILNGAGKLIAGGPPIYGKERARQIAAELGGRAQLGLGEYDPALGPVTYRSPLTGRETGGMVVAVAADWRGAVAHVRWETGARQDIPVRSLHLYGRTP